MTDTFTCPRCGMTSFNPEDQRQGYCGKCHDWTGEAVTLACIPVDGGGMVAHGSTKTKCTVCRTAVWIAPSGIKIVASKGAKPTCMRCVAAKLAEDEDPELLPIGEDQIAEIVATLLLQARRN